MPSKFPASLSNPLRLNRLAYKLRSLGAPGGGIVGQTTQGGDCFLNRRYSTPVVKEGPKKRETGAATPSARQFDALQDLVKSRSVGFKGAGGSDENECQYRVAPANRHQMVRFPLALDRGIILQQRADGRIAAEGSCRFAAKRAFADSTAALTRSVPASRPRAPNSPAEASKG